MTTPNNTSDKDFDAVKFMRDQRDRLSALLADMSTSEIIAYFKKIKEESNIKPCT
jgi:hypothetical protein